MPRLESVVFRAGDVQLAGTLTLPDADPPMDRGGRYPSVLLLPSWLPRDRDGAYDRIGHPDWFAHGPMGSNEGRPLARLADALARHGLASLRSDVRGCGASQGSWPDSDLFTRIDDARDALGWLRSRGDLDLRRTAIIGHGEGAAIAMSVAIADPAIGALTLVAGAARSLRDVLRRGVSRRAATGTDRDQPLVNGLDRFAEELIERADRHEPTMNLPLPGGQHVALRLAGWEQAFLTPPIALASMLHRSVGLLHGEDDAWVAPAESGLLDAALRRGGNRPSLRLLPGTGHGLAEASDVLIDEVAASLGERLLPRELPPVLLAIEEMG